MNHRNLSAGKRLHVGDFLEGETLSFDRKSGRIELKMAGGHLHARMGGNLDLALHVHHRFQVKKISGDGLELRWLGSLEKEGVAADTLRSYVQRSLWQSQPLSSQQWQAIIQSEDPQAQFFQQRLHGMFQNYRSLAAWLPYLGLSSHVPLFYLYSDVVSEDLNRWRYLWQLQKRYEKRKFGRKSAGAFWSLDILRLLEIVPIKGIEGESKQKKEAMSGILSIEPLLLSEHRKNDREREQAILWLYFIGGSPQQWALEWPRFGQGSLWFLFQSGYLTLWFADHGDYERYAEQFSGFICRFRNIKINLLDGQSLVSQWNEFSSQNSYTDFMA